MRSQFINTLFRRTYQTGARERPRKRALAIHDLPCFGKGLLTAALPILSAAGIETAVLPTAVLSARRDGFPDGTYRGLAGDIPKIQEHWKSLGLKFDGICTGDLSSPEQVKAVSALIGGFQKEDALVLVNPGMADGGKLYPHLDGTFPAEMRNLCGKANILVLNLTEASLLLNEPYLKGPYKRVYVDSILKKLGGLGPEKIVLTGVRFDAAHPGAAVYDTKNGEIDYVLSDCTEGDCRGAEDVFASALFAALLNDFPLVKAARIAADFTVAGIRRTRAAGSDFRFGISFEAGIPDFLKALKLFG